MTRAVGVKGGRQESRVDFAAQCQDLENSNPVFLLLFLKWETSFLEKWLTVPVSLLQVLFLGCVMVVFCTFFSLCVCRDDRCWRRTNGIHPHPGLGTARVQLYFYNHRGLLLWSGRRRGQGSERLWLLHIFPENKNPTSSSICLQRK